MTYIKLVRPINLLLIVFVQCAIKFGLLEPFGIQVALEAYDFSVLIVATLCIAGAGNVINDICDVAIDQVNKPKKVLVGTKISENAAYNLYITLNVLGVGAGFLLANRLGHPGLAAIFIGISIILYSYATYLKSLLIIGNLVISALVATSLLVLIVFDIYPAIVADASTSQISVSEIIAWYALAAFYLNFIREIVKDISDVNGDKKGDRNTLPIAIGRKRTRNIIFGMGILAVLGVLYFSYEYAYQSLLMGGYMIFLVGAPLLYFCLHAWNAEKKTDYIRLSNALKLIMFSGVCSIWLYSHLMVGQ